MYQLLATVYELHGGYYCTAELVYREDKHLEHLVSIRFHRPSLERPGKDELDEILNCLEGVCPEIAQKMDVPLF